jgi:hypothetical protein
MSKRISFFIIVLALITGIAIAIVSSNYNLLSYNINSNGGGVISGIAHKIYGILGQNVAGESEDENGKITIGYIPRVVSALGLGAADNLEEAYVYPNPYKPGSEGDYDADCITFSKLTSQAKIEVFNIIGQLVTTIEKDSSEGDYQWIPKNDAGRSLASGVYVFYISNEEGQKKTGRFAIVK